MDQRISLVTLGVENRARTAPFANHLVGVVHSSPTMKSVSSRWQEMVLGLWAALGGHGAPGIELAYNVRSSEEVVTVLAQAERAGGSIGRPAARATWGGTSGAFADPDGYVWEVAFNPGWTLRDDGSVHI